MLFSLFDFAINEYTRYISIFSIGTRYYWGSLFCLYTDEKKLLDWDFLFINYIYKRFFKKEK